MTEDERPTLWSSAIALGRERLAARDRSSLLGLLLTFVGLVVAFEGARHHGWIVTSTGVALLLSARGLVLGRRIVGFHLAVTLGLILVARWCHDHSYVGASGIVLMFSGLVLTLPGPPPVPGTDLERSRMWSLVNRTTDDTLAPFALRSDKSYFFSADGLSAIAYRVRFGTAVIAGDPIGEPGSRQAVLEAFFEHARTEGWRVAGLGVSERDLPLWQSHGFWGLSIGRDVVIDVESFSLSGRTFRNLRQAVQRTVNFGVTTEIVAESRLTQEVRDELRAILMVKGHKVERGFAMILDKQLCGQTPGVYIAYARDASGRIVAAARFATADSGRELSLDIPWRAPGAPNGVDERLVVDMVAWAKEHQSRRLSLAFAAFPDLFLAEGRGRLQEVGRRAIKVLDPLIKLESLFRYLRKFHAFDQHRYVVMRRRSLVPVAFTMLVLEFALIGVIRRPRLKPRKK